MKVHDLATADVPGRKILVDRLWPRGIRKDDLGQDEWLKEVAPSPELRKWFGHDPARFAEFARRYHDELDAGNKDIDRLRSLVDEGDITLLYAARDREINHAVVLADWLQS